MSGFILCARETDLIAFLAKRGHCSEGREAKAAWHTTAGYSRNLQWKEAACHAWCVFGTPCLGYIKISLELAAPQMPADARSSKQMLCSSSKVPQCQEARL